MHWMGDEAQALRPKHHAATEPAAYLTRWAAGVIPLSVAGRDPDRPSWVTCPALDGTPARRDSVSIGDAPHEPPRERCTRAPSLPFTSRDDGFMGPTSEGVTDRVSLRWSGDDGDGIGKLTVTASANGFGGQSGARFTGVAIIDFALEIRSYPLPVKDIAIRVASARTHTRTMR